MPKKFQGENSKAVTAKARKAEAKAVADAKKKKELEDAMWEDNDKHVMKKEQRKVLCDDEPVAVARLCFRLSVHLRANRHTVVLSTSSHFK